MTGDQPTRGMPAVAALLDEWARVCVELAALEHAEHPDVVDQFGRAWQWSGRGDLYCHDETLAYPQAYIGALGLPPDTLADNPNYARLCDICTRLWPDDARAQIRAHRTTDGDTP